jgi:glycosyltransferase involved in cell wall biosynthesis
MHGHWVIPGGITAALAAPEVPLVVSLHGSDAFVAERFAPARLAARIALRRAGAVTACSADLATRAIRLGADPGRTMVVPYGVDTARFAPDPATRRERRAAFGVSTSKMLVAAAGRLVSKKGFEYLIDSLPRVPDAVLVLAGEGSLRDELQRRAAALGVHERIRFIGNRPQDEVAALFSAADVIVAPSIRDDAGNVDGLPNVVMEGLASGTPLVTTSAGGIGAVVEDGVSAIVVAERDAAGIASALQRIQSDPAFAARVGGAARQIVAHRFGWDRTAEQFEAAYRAALALHETRR